MTTVKLSCHNVAMLSAKYAAMDTSCWVEITATDHYGGTFTQTLFFEDAALARAYSEAINNVVPVRMIAHNPIVALQQVCGND